jgi:predicted kinase
MGAGKTSMSKKEAEEKNAVLISEDDWLSAIYGNQITDFSDYLRCSRQIKPLLKSLVQNILCTGTHVVLDYPANTASQRAWLRNLCFEVNAPHEMIYLEASNEVCLAHVASRKVEQPERAAFDTEEVFTQVTQYFEEPGKAEKLNIRKIEVRT